MRFTSEQLIEALRQTSEALVWSAESINDFHSYAQRFGAGPGTNVFEFVLREALDAHGLTLEQFRALPPRW